MRETVYIRLRDAAPDAAVAYAVVHGDAGGALRAQHAPLTQVLALAAGRRIVVFVPAADVRLASVAVPSRNAQKVLQAAPFVLEDQLAEDTDTLHFALGPRQPDGSHPVAVIARARMDAWLQPFQAQSLRPDVLVPESLCLPWGGDTLWGMLAEEDLITVRSGVFAGFGCKPDDLDTYLHLADPEARFGLRIVQPRELQADFTKLDRAVELLPAFGDVLETLIRQWQPATSINLMQGAYSQGDGMARLWQPWRPAATLAFAWVLLTLVAAAAHAIRLGQELSAQEAWNLQRFQQLFPQETRIVDVGAQAEQQLALLKGNSAGGGLFSLLETLAQALSANPGFTLQSMQFREGAVYLSITGSDLQTLETLREWFTTTRQAIVEVQSANAGSDGAQIRLKMTPAGAS